MAINQVGSSANQNRGVGSAGFSEIPQNYRTEEVLNNRTALYSLTIRFPNPPYQNVLRYIFPLSPSELRQSYTEMSSIYDVAGTTDSSGVTRIVDQYGTSPITFTIEGTTGWKKHSADGFSLTGLESAKLIRTMLLIYSGYNLARAAVGAAPYILEFYDYFQGNFWEVVPVGEVVLRQTSSQPLLFFYHIKLAGIRSLSSAPQQPAKSNVIDQMLSTAASTVASTASSFAAKVTGAYQEITGAL